MPGMPAGFASGPPPGGSISPSQLASQAAHTLLGNATASAASPTAIDLAADGDGLFRSGNTIVSQKVLLANLTTALQRGVDPTQIQIITSGTTGTISDNTRIVVLSTAAGAFSLTAPALSTGGGSCLIWKSTTDANAITIVRTGSETIQGTAANYVLPGSTFASMLGWTLFTYDTTGNGARAVV